MLSGVISGDISSIVNVLLFDLSLLYLDGVLDFDLDGVLDLLMKFTLFLVLYLFFRFCFAFFTFHSIFNAFLLVFKFKYILACLSYKSFSLLIEQYCSFFPITGNKKSLSCIIISRVLVNSKYSLIKSFFNSFIGICCKN